MCSVRFRRGTASAATALLSVKKICRMRWGPLGCLAWDDPSACVRVSAGVAENFPLRARVASTRSSALRPVRPCCRRARRVDHVVSMHRSAFASSCVSCMPNHRTAHLNQALPVHLERVQSDARRGARTRYAAPTRACRRLAGGARTLRPTSRSVFSHWRAGW